MIVKSLGQPPKRRINWAYECRYYYRENVRSSPLRYKYHSRPIVSELLLLALVFACAPNAAEAFTPVVRRVQVPTNLVGCFNANKNKHCQHQHVHTKPTTRVTTITSTRLASAVPLVTPVTSAAVPMMIPIALGVSRFVMKGITTFLADWKTFSLIPVIAAFVGWFTNYLAVQMIFYPIEWCGIPIKRIEGEPLGLLGWQGIVPAKTEKMSLAMVNTTINELLSIEEVIQRLDPDKVADILLPEVPQIIKPFVDNLVSPQFQSIVNNVIASNEWFRRNLGRRFLINLTVDIQNNIMRLLDLRKCVVDQMLADKSLLGKLFQKTGGKELSFLTQSGLWFGFLLGCIQMIVALYWDNPWSFSIGGCIVGLATNWLALKWIFEPVLPTRFGPFTLQGLFLRRQKEVASDFSNFFATKILTSRQLWNSILTDPTTSPVFVKLFADNVVKLTKNVSRGMVDVLVGSETMAKLNGAATTATALLPKHLTGLHGYVDSTLDIEATLRTEMQAMSSERFERVLHPIFEEDELTLVLAGAFLGFLAGLVQQGLASGVLVLPKLQSLRKLSPFLALVVLSNSKFWLKRWKKSVLRVHGRNSGRTSTDQLLSSRDESK
jgi:uncharacterized membrane protein YheB (UPF0754 family)